MPIHANPTSRGYLPDAVSQWTRMQKPAEAPAQVVQETTGARPDLESHLAVAAADRGYACVYRATGGQLPFTCSTRGDVLSARERLEQYLEEVRERLRATVFARAGAVVALTALFVTLIAVAVLRDPGFPPSAVWTARIALGVALLVAAMGHAVATTGRTSAWAPREILRATSALSGRTHRNVHGAGSSSRAWRACSSHRSAG